MRISRKQKILDYLKKHGSITQMQALDIFWDWRLSDKIYRLKKDGYKIKSEDIKVKRADNTDAYVAKYTLEEMEIANENHIPSLY